MDMDTSLEDGNACCWYHHIGLEDETSETEMFSPWLMLVLWLTPSQLDLKLVLKTRRKCAFPMGRYQVWQGPHDIPFFSTGDY
jgi:hypothetical protein